MLLPSFGSAGVAFGRFWRASAFIWLGRGSVWALLACSGFIWLGRGSVWALLASQGRPPKMLNAL